MNKNTAIPSLLLPFLGIVDRPYDQSFLENINRREITPTSVRFSGLWLTQSKLTVEGMFGKRYSLDEFPHIVKYQGELYVEDGTHRLVIMALRRVVVAPMRVIEWEKYSG